MYSGEFSMDYQRLSRALGRSTVSWRCIKESPPIYAANANINPTNQLPEHTISIPLTTSESTVVHHIYQKIIRIYPLISLFWEAPSQPTIQRSALATEPSAPALRSRRAPRHLSGAILLGGRISALQQLWSPGVPSNHAVNGSRPTGETANRG